MSLSEKISSERLPQHIAVIMDGNGRWAKSQGAKRIYGHQNALTSVRETTEGCAELGVKYLTLFAFSTENWGRPPEEINALMELLVNTISGETPTLMQNKVKLACIGDIDGLPENCRKSLLKSIDDTKENDRMTLSLALNYSGRWEISEACKIIATKVKQGLIDPDDINQDTVAQHLPSSNLPDPELLIRTSGELRISNFLLWQIAYTELHITKVFWPDFRKENLYEAIIDYQNRERRFGKV